MLVKLKIEDTNGKFDGYIDGTVKHFKTPSDCILFLENLDKPPLPFKEVLDYFNKCNGVALRPTKQKKEQLMARRKYKLDEIKKAIYNRSLDPFMIENKYREKWDSLFRNDEQIEKWMMKAAPNNEPEEITQKNQVNLIDYLNKIGK